MGSCWPGLKKSLAWRRQRATIAKALKVAEGTPLLTLDCIVYAIDGRPIEWRVAHCNLRHNHYYAEIN